MLERHQTLDSTQCSITPRQSYSQLALLKKINLYLTAMKRSPWPFVGHCHGLTSVWQQKMADYQEESFYSIIKKIIDYPVSRLAELDDDIDVQKFLAQIEYAQNSSRYPYGDVIQQKDVQLIMESSEWHRREAYFSQRGISDLLTAVVRDRTSVIIKGGWRIIHSIGLFYRDDHYYLFDANYQEL